MAYQYPFSNAPESVIQAVWRKGDTIIDYSVDEWRRDQCGHPIKFDDHGNTGSKHGWEIDHIVPAARGGSDDLANLQPLYWENNRRKSDTYPWGCENAA